MKYNRALDLLCGAAEYMLAKKPMTAAKIFAQACKDPSIKSALRIVEASNSEAHATLVKAQKRTQAAARRRIRAENEDASNAGEELRIDLDENGDRVVQEADFDEMVGDEDFDEEVLSAADEDEDKDEDEDEDEGEKEEAAVRARAKATKQTATARFAQTLKNLNSLK